MSSEVIEKSLEFAATPSLPTLHIRPSRGWLSLGLKEVWEYRELLYFLIWRDLKVRYKQTALGVGWAVLQPLMTMIIFSVIFGRLAKLPSDGIPYPIFSFAALVPWTFFANGLGQASNSLVSSAHLLTKVYFPRLIIPIVGVLSGIVDLAIALVMLLGLMLYYGIAPTINVLWLPLFLLMAVVNALGVGLWLSALNVQYRDVRYVLPFMIQFWMYATPIAYSSSLLSEPWRTVYALNPMVGVIEGFRWSMLGTDHAPGPMIIVSGAVSIVTLISGAFFFRRMEKTFADSV